MLAVDARARAAAASRSCPPRPKCRAIAIRYFPYRHDSYFYYLSGFPEPEAVVALVAGPDGDRHVLFCREKNEEREIWDGFRYGPDAAREIFGFDEAHPIAELDAMLPDLAADRPALYTPLGLFEPWDRQVTDAAERSARARAHRRRRARRDRRRARRARCACGSSRTRTSSTLMRRAAAISSGAHRRAMERTRPGWYEYQVEAELLHEFLRHGAQAVAYPSIVAFGPERLRAALSRQQPADAATASCC